MLADTIEPIRAAFDGLLPQANIRVWQAPGPVRELDAANTWRRQAAELLREAFLASLKPDVVHVSSLFEGYGDDAATSIGRFTESYPTAVTLYDLIPLLNPDEQLKANASYMDYYWRKIGHIERARLLLTISESSRTEALNALHIPADSAVNISSAADARFKPAGYTDAQQTSLFSGFGIQRPFVLYVGAADPRKNLERLIAAFAALPPALRGRHQLVIAGVSDQQQRQNLQLAAKGAGLDDDALCLAGEVSDEQLPALYNLCRLFVFPSLHEGFGLPALEAMACGAAVIASNTSSLPEVVGREDALFDPTDEQAIANKMAQALTDADFRRGLQQHGLEQARRFSWDASARRAIAAFEQLHARQTPEAAPARCRPPRRPLLAYVSPLPPERTGIADYSAELLPELARHYDIEVVTPQAEVTHPWVRANCPVRSVAWFRANAPRYDRVMYHFGNSPFHSHMFDLLPEVPGVVVLHDFFLSSVQWHDEAHGVRRNAWTRELQHAHGYAAVRERFDSPDAAHVVRRYPCNLSILQHAQGIIVHSQASRELARQWYGSDFAKDWTVIPLLRAPALANDAPDARRKARQELGVPDEAFLVCSFGMLGPSKANHRLLDAWLASPLAQNPHCQLVFVGENHGGDYGAELLAAMQMSGLGSRISITGWVNEAVFRQYLLAADMAVQLRSRSRGETSAAVLDCMNHGLPTIVNAHGSMAELPDDAVRMLPDELTDAQLAEALSLLHADIEQRRTLGSKAQHMVRQLHAPSACAGQYTEAIERFHAQAQAGSQALIRAMASLDNGPQDDASWLGLVHCMARNHPLPRPTRQLLVDVTATARSDLKTGIERVARALLLEWLQRPPVGFQVEPVCLNNVGSSWHYRYARSFASHLLEFPPDALADTPAEYRHGDILLTLDLSGDALVHAEKAGLYRELRNAGVEIYCTLYDLLPIRMPQFFPPGADQGFSEWLSAIARCADGVVAISRSAANDFADWMRVHGQHRPTPCKLAWSPLGADLMNSAATRGLPGEAPAILATLSASPSFLMVGTIEPRKGHLQTLAAFEMLWAKGEQINLVIVGKEGWVGLDASARRTIPEIVERLHHHPEAGRRLFWLEGISDEYLEKLYATCACLISASEGEGFGLPLTEAMRHKRPIIARDIPVFREVAGSRAHYFSGSASQELANSIGEWLTMFRNNRIPAMHDENPRTWRDSANGFIAAIMGGEWPLHLCNAELSKKALDRHLDLIHQARISLVSSMLPAGKVILDLGGANCPLYKMGYPHPFDKLILIDLPPEQRDFYREVVVDTDGNGGEIVIQYSDMTELDDFPDESVDLIWSGQSIEHVSPEAGRRMCKSAFRVLRKDGAFCLDTPNRQLTEIHTRGIGGGFIHPEHCIEYRPEQLKQLLLDAGFVIKQSLGVCEMPNTLATGEFSYEDFLYGQKIVNDVSRGYIQYFHCVKPSIKIT
ncbi:glycosyltransferase [Thiomonas sp. X19]|uniref:glycosyltransferase n=1 Tax=Thiomonas sp. X19 TaxID=1050370 RepID=UPI001E3604F6|nr:glycosyltransferase [Thiomonas sp. X19]